MTYYVDISYGIQHKSNTKINNYKK